MAAGILRISHFHIFCVSEFAIIFLYFPLYSSYFSLGNILGSLIAGAFVKYNWGLSFTVPGLMIAGVGFLLFLCLVPRPELVGMGEETSGDSQWPRRDTEVGNENFQSLKA